MALTTAQAIDIGATALQGMNMASSWMDGGHSARKTFRKNLDYQYEKQKEALETITKPYYEYQLRNNPRLTVEGLKAAGINPLMVYGQNAGINGSTDSVTPDVDADYSGIANSEVQAAMMRTQGISSMADNLKTLAEVNKIKADTDNVKADTQTKMTYNEFQRQLLAGEVKTQEGNILNIALEGDVKRSIVQKYRAECDALDAQTSNLNAQTKNLSETYNLLLQQGKINEAELERIASETALNQAREMRENFGINLDKAQIANLASANALMAAQGNALYPATLLADYLKNSPEGQLHFAGESYKSQLEGFKHNSAVNRNLGSQSDLNFSTNENNRLTLQLRQGNTFGYIKENSRRAQEQDGPVAGVVAVGQSLIEILNHNVGSMLNGVAAGVVKK